MKQTDITSKVMTEVAKYEKEKIRLFRLRLWIALAVILSVCIVGSVVIVWQLNEMQAFDLLTLFSEDRQIIAEFWQDTLSTFWEYIPPQWFWGVILSLFCLGAILFITRRRRRINKKKLAQLSKYTNY